MQLRIVHQATVTYAGGKAEASYHLARLTPRSSADQIVVSTRIEVTPSPYTYTYRDYFGASVTAFEVLDPHEQLTVTATSTVHSQPRSARPDTLGWADLSAPEVADRYTEFLELPDHVRPPDDLVGRLGPLRSGDAAPGEVARLVCGLVHEQVEHVADPSAADAGAGAGRAWAQRAGTATDLAHLTLGCLRTMGLPARYVAGYHHPEPDAAVGAEVAGRPHAWVEWWDDGWQGFDPTCDRAPSDAYVLVAAGRDEGDVRPLGGIYSGDVTSRTTVDVRVSRLG